MEKGETAKKHKYIDRVKKKNGYQYIYSEPSKKSSSKISGAVSNFLKTAANTISNTAKKAASTVSTKAKSVSNTAAKTTSEIISNTKKKASSIKDKITNYANKNKESEAKKKEATAKKNAITVQESIKKILDAKKAAEEEQAELDKIKESQKKVFNLKNVEQRRYNKSMNKTNEEEKKKTADVPEPDNSKESMLEEYPAFLNPEDYDYPYQDYLYDVSELKEKDYESTEDEDMALVNPYYKLDDGSQYYEFSMNCASCSLAYELRRRGYDVEAGAMVAQGASAENILTTYGITEKDVSTAYASSVSVKEVEKYMLNEYGDETRGQFMLFWKNGGGHSVVWEIQNSEVIIRDAQTNTIYTLDDVYNKCDTVSFFRIDNLDTNNFNLGIENDLFVHNRKD